MLQTLLCPQWQQEHAAYTMSASAEIKSSTYPSTLAKPAKHHLCLREQSSVRMCFYLKTALAQNL